MASIQTTAGVTSYAIPSHRVYVRQTWAAAWTLQPYLYCDTACKRAAPEKSTAVLHYDYGWIVRPGTTAPALFAPLALDHWYIKIVIDQPSGGLGSGSGSGGGGGPITWYGVIYERSDDAYGAPLSDATPPARQPTGRQKLTAYGLEELLAREVVRQSTVENPLAGSPGAPAEVDVNRPIGFNWTGSHADDVIVPNRSFNLGLKGAPIFGGDLAAATHWQSADIVEYLLAYRSPAGPAGTPPIPFVIDAASALNLPSWDRPRLKPKLETVKELLDQLISRKRFVSYYVDVAPGQFGSSLDEAVLYPFTFTAANLSIPTSYPNATGGQTLGSATIPANANQITIDYDEAYDVEYATLRRDGHSLYDVVVARGARKTSTFSVSFKDGTLEPDWDTGALQTEYRTAASAQPDYPEGLSALMQWRNQLWRSADKYKRVFRWFRVPKTWPGLVNDGENTGTDSPAFPVDDDFALLNSFYRPALQFASHLPLLTDHDYTGANILNGTVTDTTPAGGLAERLKPMAWLKVLTGSTTRYQHVEKLSEVAKTDKHALGAAAFTCSLAARDRGFGIELNVHGHHQHAIAASDFTPVDFSDITPVIDYRNNLVATLAVEHDHHVEATYPTTPPTGELVRRLLIDLTHAEFNSACRLDYVVPGTVLAVKDGVLQRSTSGGYARDDRGRLDALAQVAYTWYSQQRQAFTLKFRQISGLFKLGQLVTQVGSGASAQQVNTPITSIEWDLLNGATTVTTGFAELDFGHFE